MGASHLCSVCTSPHLDLVRSMRNDLGPKWRQISIATGLTERQLGYHYSRGHEDSDFFIAVTPR